MTQKIPRNVELHERRHKRKAGAHGAPSRPLTAPRDALLALITEYGADSVAMLVNDIRRERMKLEGEKP